MSFNRGIVFIPEQSPARQWASQVVAQMDSVLVPALMADQAELAVADLTVPEGLAALQKLRESPAGRALTVVSLVDWSGQAPPAPALLTDDWVNVALMEKELLLRLRQARLRHAEAKDAATRQRDLSLLLELTGRYAESLDVVEMLHDVTRRLADAMDIKRASLVVLDEPNDAGVVVAANDAPALRGLRIDLSRYPEIREVLRTGKPVIVEDAPSHPLLEGVQVAVAARGIRAIAALPLTVQGKVLGVLLLRASPTRKAFSPREIDFLLTVAHATAVALRNARLLESIRGETEREKSARIAAEARAADLKRYEAYFANVSEGIAILDDKACVLSLNPAGSALFDVTPAEARGRHINALARPGDEALMLDVLCSVSAGEARRDVDLPVRTVKGRRLTLSMSAAPLTEDGAAAIVSFRDVTLARQTADELRQTKDFLERLIDSSVDAIIASDMKGRVILFNKGAEAITGYKSEDALAGLNASAIYPTGVARAVMSRLRSPEWGGKGRLNLCREEIVTRSGERVPVNLTASILYEGEREAATVGIFTDLRDRVQLERRLSDAEVRLEESERNAVIVALAGTAAHELNQPLTSVMGYAELLKRKLVEGDFAYRPVDIIYREAERMAEIVRKIGKITRYETMPYPGGTQILDLEKASSNEE